MDVSLQIYSDIKNKEECEIQIYDSCVNLNNMLNDNLTSWKNKINDNKNWDVAKRISNTFEFIFSSGYNKVNVSKKKPISRSYFKLWEIMHDFDLMKPGIQTAHIAEGPGGFIECICDYVTKYNITTHTIYGITLSSSNNKKIPSWKIPRWILNKHNVNLYDIDDGNIYNMRTINNFINFVGYNSCSLVTSDGGFDFSADFNNQELHSLKLMICEIFIGLNIQKSYGNMLVKVFDLFSIRTIKLISLCSEFYESFIILKPQTSRPANSEKYILFQNYNNILFNNHKKNLMILKSTIEHDDLTIFDTYSVIKDVIVGVTKFNVIYTSSQIHFLDKTLKLSNTDMNTFVKNKHFQNNVAQCKEWCTKYMLETISN
tara:strand:+ start:318 stop:1436 length:1119 start_codon:yes stop_codon:yes gene_type:complete